MPSIPLAQIRTFPHNVRQPQDDDQDDWLPCLAEDIAKNGLLHPITVRPSLAEPGSYDVIAGQRRCAACKLLEWEAVDAVVVDADDAQSFLISLSENMHRRPMSNKEKCAALARCFEDCGQDVGKVCAVTHLAPSTVRRYIQISSLADDVIDRLDAKGDDRLTLAEAHDMARTAANGPQEEEPAPELPQEERPPRKRALKADPWVFDPNGKPEPIPEALFASVHAMIERTMSD
jgi:ParB family chromosome partitioning protein